MKTREDIQAYMIRSGLPFEEVDEATWLVRISTGRNAVVRLEGPLVLVRADVGPIPKKDRERFYAELLRENAGDLVHCAYGIDGDQVIVSDALILETLDYDELVSTLDDMGMVLSRRGDGGGA
jgi:hypothetical protein